MADKVNKEESIARVYQFLSKQKNWKEDADLNGDKTIIKTEFRSYLLGSNFKWNNDENKNDIINAFWKSIDVNTKGSVNGASQISNQNALDGKELNKMDNNILAIKVVNNYILDNNISAPTGENGIQEKYAAKWKESVKAGVLNQIIAELKDYNEKFEDEEALKNYLGGKLAEFCTRSSAKATADYKALGLMDEIAADYKDTDVDYKPQSDDVLGGIIDEYISGDDIEGKSEKEILADIDSIVNYYKMLADDDPKNDTAAIKALAKYDSTIGEDWNPLQIAVIKAKFAQAVDKTLSASSKYKDFYAANKDAVKSAISSFIDSKITESDFNSLLSNMNSVVESFIKSNVDALNDDYKLITDRNEFYLNKVVVEWNKSEHKNERQEAIKNIFGKEDINEIQKVIQGYTRAELDAKIAEFDAAMKNVNAILPDNFLNGVPSTITVVQGGTINPIQLTNNYGTQYQVGHLHFKETSGCSAITVGDAGQITVNSSNQGQWTAAIEVYNDEGVRVAGPKSIVVNVIKAMKLEESDKTFNGQTMSFILSNVDKNAIQLSGFEKWSSAKNKAKASIRTYVNNIKSALSSAGYDSARLTAAANNTILYYNAIIDQINDQISSSGDGMKEVTFTYVDTNGKSHTETSTFSQCTRSSERRAGRNDSGAKTIDQGSTGIRMNESYNSSNTYEYYLNSAVLLKKFQEFYNSI